MPYVKRDKDNQIIALFKDKTDEANEELLADDPEVIDFVTNTQDPVRQLQTQLTFSDIEMIRALEDLIDVLIDKDVIAITDLPPKVLEKISKRKRIREKIHSMGKLFSGSEEDLEPED